MTDPTKAPVTLSEDPWAELRRFTASRIALGRCGSSLPLAASLSFRLDHARARDAVHTPFQRAELAGRLRGAGMACVELESGVNGREEYLTRPAKGRGLSPRSTDVLRARKKGFDICLAVADEIGEILRARMSVILIGERPGLSSPNSMGVYLTMNPRVGTTDEARNCISNVREGGLSLAEGLRKLGYLVEEAFRLGQSGVGLKDRMAADFLPFGRPLPELGV